MNHNRVKVKPAWPTEGAMIDDDLGEKFWRC
jgi:hypothetical protein